MSFKASTLYATSESTLHSELSMQNHVKNVAQTCFYHIRRLKQVQNLLAPEVTAKLVTSLEFSRLDYCNAVLTGLPRSTIAPCNEFRTPQPVLWPKRLFVARLGRRDHVTPTLKDRHWLPIEQRSNYVYWCTKFDHTGRAPSYLRSCVTASADVTSRPRLRSTSSQRYERQRTRLEERSFSCAGSRAWNNLPSSLHELTYTSTFKRHLKLFVFNKRTKTAWGYMHCV